MEHTDLYRILGLKHKASIDEVKRAYRALARRYHPDSGTTDANQVMFQAITEAYNILSSEKTKAEYDERADVYNDLSEKIEAYREADKMKLGAEKARQRERAKKSGQSESGTINRPPTEGQFEGPAGLRFSKHKADSTAARGEKSSLLGRLSQKLDTFTKNPDSIVGKVSSTLRRPMDGKSTNAKLVIDDREYRFTINALESIQGATREIAVDDGGTPRLIRVKIPPGVASGALLSVNCPPKSVEGKPDSVARRVHVRVHVEPHDLVEREGYDIIVRIPLSMSEAVNGGEVDVPTLDGPLRLRIPPGWDLKKRLRVKGKGLPLPDSGEQNRVAGQLEPERGNLFVETYVVLPPPSTELSEAAEKVAALYHDSPRATLPKSLTKPSESS